MAEQTQHTPTQTPSPVSVGPPSVDMRPYSKRQHLLQELLRNSELLLKNRLEVRHLMTHNPITIPPSMTLEEMDFLMKERRLRHLLVCARNGELLGVISDRDLRPQRGTTAQQLMSYPVLTATPETPLNPAITFLINENISCLPIVDDGRLVGILTTTDLVLSLQCTLQLWLRLAQVIQQESNWTQELDKIAASLDGNLTQAEFAAQVRNARGAIRRQIDDIVHCVSLDTDVLTGISNRHGLEETLNMLLAMRKRYEQPFALVIAAIDHFQQISETGGDAVVRPLLRATVKLLSRAARTSDFIARCHDGAFAVVLTQTDMAGAEKFSHRLLAAAKNDAGLDVPLRIRTAAVVPEPGEDATRLLNRAEAALISDAAVPSPPARA